ncbi:MAG: hypothetical protein V4717_22255 [Bacteroidota bacterium]
MNEPEKQKPENLPQADTAKKEKPEFLSREQVGKLSHQERANYFTNMMVWNLNHPSNHD